MGVITGAAATGKSTLATQLAGDIEGATFVDGDVIAEGASAVADGRRDYDAYWAHVLRLCHEIAASRSVPIVCGIGLPEQLENNPEAGWFRSIRYLALVCHERELEDRMRARSGAGSEAKRVEFHIGFNERVRDLASTRSDVERLDVTRLDSVEVVAAGKRWVENLVAMSMR